MKPEDFLVKDYELKVDYLNGHLSRMWTRFNFFLVIHVALFGLFFDKGSDCASYLALVGFILAVLWYIFAATDNKLADVYRDHVEIVFLALKPTWTKAAGDIEAAALTNNGLHSLYSFVGDTKTEGVSRKGKNGKLLDCWQKLNSFRWPSFSVTELGVVFSWLFAGVWFVLFWFWQF